MENFKSALNDAMANKIPFLVAFFVIFTVSYGILYAFDFYPELVTTETREKAIAATTSASIVVPTEEIDENDSTSTDIAIGEDTLPKTLTIPSLERTVTVLNPASNSVSALDTALLKGVIRHPDSATFTEEGNMFILGHSSYLPTVLNRNFQALNGIQNLKWGDTIVLASADTEYTYKVEKNFKVKASGFTVPVAGKGKTLTLVTCNSFGSKEDRYIVEAILVKTTTL